jgi:hypothetical protein
MMNTVGVMKAVVAAGLVVAASGCDTHGAAEEAVRAQLKDGDSAKFRNLYVKTQFSGQYVGTKFVNDVATCGEVNAKNGYGAYTGFRRFYVLGSSVTIPDDGDDIGMRSLKLHCDG